MLPRAIEQRVIYVAGSAFFVDGTGANILRLSFSLPSKEKIVEGVQRLTRVIKEELAAATGAGGSPTMTVGACRVRRSRERSAFQRRETRLEQLRLVVAR